MEKVEALTSIGRTAEELAAIDSLRQSIGWGAGSWFLGAMVADGGTVLAATNEDGLPIAMGGASNCGSFGFICNMVVSPELKRRGLGRTVFEALLDWHRGRGLATVQLEATEEGKPLYEQYGFTTRWESVSAALNGPVDAGDESGITALRADDWDDIAALDQGAYGGVRSGVLRRLMGGSNSRGGLVVRDSGRLVGYGLRFAGRIGPVVAANPGTAERLARALAVRSEAGTLATVGHPQHTAMWERIGFTVQPFDVRMVAGLLPEDRPEMVYCMLNGGIG